MNFYNLPHPTIIAHRGSSFFAPENTLSAFLLAVEQGADAIELDAKLTADNKVIVIHDQSVNRTTNGSGKVREKTLKELQQLDAGGYFNESYKGQKLPSLEEVFQAVGRKIFINVELTNYASPTDELPTKVAELTKEYNLHERVIFSSFNPLALIRIHKLLPETPIGFLTFPGAMGTIIRTLFGPLIPYKSLHPDVKNVTTSLITSIHKSGKYIYPYTSNDKDQIRALFQMGIDGIFTDNPVLAQEIRKTL